MTDRIRVTDVIEVDTDRVLLGGTRLRDNERVSFHVQLSEEVQQMVQQVRSGFVIVEVEI